MARFDGEIMDLFSSRSPREEEEVSLLGWSWNICSKLDFWRKKTAFLLRLVQDPARSKWPAFTSFYERSNSRYALVSLRNRTAGRRGRQNACAWRTWQGHYFRVLSCSSLTSMFSGLLQKDLLKGGWIFAKSYSKQKYCHACHTRFAVFFPLPSCCVSLLIKPKKKKIQFKRQTLKRSGIFCR